MADDFDISRLLANLEIVDGWTITGANSAHRVWKEANGEDVEAYFEVDGDNIGVELFVDEARTSTGPYSASFPVADFSGPVARSAVGSKFYQWVTHVLSQDDAKRFDPETKVPTDVWTRHGGPPNGAYRE
jgi:hypothetical protein